MDPKAYAHIQARAPRILEKAQSYLIGTTPLGTIIDGNPECLDRLKPRGRTKDPGQAFVGEYAKTLKQLGALQEAMKNLPRSDFSKDKESSKKRACECQYNPVRKLLVGS